MLLIAKELGKTWSLKSRQNYKLGDRVLTKNNRLGTVVHLKRDEVGEYIIVKLDTMLEDFAYDPWDLEKVSE